MADRYALAHPLTERDWDDVVTWMRSKEGPCAGMPPDDAEDFTRHSAFGARFDYWHVGATAPVDLFVLHPEVLGGSPIVLRRGRGGWLREVEYPVDGA